jgi:SAM-dependent methyltransferase
LNEIEDRRARLSAEKRALLEKRLKGLSAAAAVAEARPAAEPAPQIDAAKAAADAGFASELTAGTVPPVDREIWQAMIGAGAQEAGRRAVARDLVADAAHEPKIDEQAAAFLSAAFRQLGVFQQAGETRTIAGLIAECRVLPKYDKVLRRWLEALVEEGLLERRRDAEGHDAYSARQPVPTPRLDALMTDEQRAYYAKNLAAVLTGDTHPLEFYLPGGSSASIESSYTETPIFRYCNGISAAVLEAQARGLPEGARLRLLEIGAGTGGTTKSLLPLLSPDRTVFLFTDVSKFFTDLGRKRLGEYPFVRYRELDIELDPVPQGYPAGSFDWIVAAHVLHATRNVGETLRHIVRLLAPGGVLLLLEETRFQRKYNFSMGFLPGFDHFEDYDRRPLHPLLSSAQWREALLTAGFVDFATFTQPGSAADVLGVDVMLARAAGGF